MTKLKIYRETGRGCREYKYNLLILPPSDNSDITNVYNETNSPFDEHNFVNAVPYADLVFNDELKQKLIARIDPYEDPDEDQAFQVYNLIRDQIVNNSPTSKYATGVDKLIRQTYEKIKYSGDNHRSVSWIYDINFIVKDGPNIVHAIIYHSEDNDGCGCMTFDAPIAVYTDEDSANNMFMKCRNVQHSWSRDPHDGRSFRMESFVYLSDNFK